MFALNPVGKTCVIGGIVVGLLTWFALASMLGNNQRVSGISVLIGTAATSVVDFVYRVLNHREKGVVRLVHSDCGGAYFAIPVWAVGVVFFAGFGHWLFFEC